MGLYMCKYIHTYVYLHIRFFGHDSKCGHPGVLNATDFAAFASAQPILAVCVYVCVCTHVCVFVWVCKCACVLTYVYT